jgi:hypothetical protein
LGEFDGMHGVRGVKKSVWWSGGDVDKRCRRDESSDTGNGRES